MNLKQPPHSEAVKGLDHLRAYALQKMIIFNTLKLAIVGKENVGKTVLTYRLIDCVTDAEKHMTERNMTAGVHHESLKVKRGNGSELELLIWDYVSIFLNAVISF